jgi:chitosanase
MRFIVLLCACVAPNPNMTQPGDSTKLPPLKGQPSMAPQPSMEPQPPTQPSTPPSMPPAAYGLDAAHKLRAMQLISVFENDTIVLAYDYVEALGDGRGYTCGLGFTTGTGDAYEVVKDYTAKTPNNPLAMYLPRLQQLAQSGSGSTGGLTGFPDAWKQAAKDADFCRIQEQVQDQNSYDPALAHAQALGLQTNLGITVLYDTVWMHGDGDDPDGTPALIMKAGPMNDEATWLESFLAARRADLLNPADSSTQAEWSQAVGRVDELSDLLTDKNFDLHGPIDVQHGYDVIVP